MVFLTLGGEEGDDNHLVVAELPGAGDAPIYLHASALTPGEPALTTVAGVVLDNTDAPVPGVTLRIAGSGLAATSDDAGQFTLGGVPVGEIELVADGSTVTLPGPWPTLAFEMVTVAGRLNSLGRPIHMLPLDVASGVAVDPAAGASLTLAQVPGFELEIAPGSATFGDGGGSGQVAVTVVHSDKVPMLPNFGEQPLLALTIQPPDVTFDPPARITLPNVEGLAPGAVSEIFSFRHDQGQFVSVGTASVSADGATLTSDPGFGIVQGGWHIPPRYPRRPPRGPRANSCGGCPQCKDCVSGSCRPPSAPRSCDDGKFCTQNDKCSLGSCSGQEVKDQELGTVQIDVAEIGEGIEGPVRFFTFGGQCELTEPKFFGNLQAKKTRKCCESLNTFKTNDTLTGTGGFTGLGFKCLLPGASVNAGLFKAGVRAGGSYGGSVQAKIGCGNASFNGMAGPLKVHGTVKLFGFLSVTVEEEVPGTKFGPI